MSEEKVKSTRKYTNEYKKGAIKLALETGNRKASFELGIPENTLYGWVAKARSGEIDMGSGFMTPEETLSVASELKAAKEEIKRLTKENTKKQETIEFLTEATAFFAASRQK